MEEKPQPKSSLEQLPIIRGVTMLISLVVATLIASADLTGSRWPEPLLTRCHLLPDFIPALAFSPTLDMFAASSSQISAVSVWDVKTGKLIAELEKPEFGFVTSLRFSPDGKLLAAGGLHGENTLWNVQTKKVVRTLAGHTDTVNGLAFDKEQSVLLSGSRDETIRVWDLKSGKALATLKGQNNYISAVAVSPDGSKIVGLGGDTMCVWDRKTSKLVTTREVSPSVEPVLQFTPDGSYLLVAGSTKAVTRWDTKTWKSKGVDLEHHKEHDGQFSPDSKYFVGCAEGEVAIWDTATGKRLHSEKRQKEGNHIAVGFDPENRLLAAVNSRFEIKLAPAFRLGGKEK